ncbi:MAG: hypothetical protein JNL12_01565 [Planctomycetes bacterium]|nr:hypothetical protein [Planctomycetota bacterium]
MSQQAAKILSVPTAADYVLPARPRGNGEIVVVPPAADGLTALRRGGDVARTIGARFRTLAEGQRLFLDEVRERLTALDGAIADSSRAQLKGAVRELAAVLDWCDAVQADLLQEAAAASLGAEPIDVATLAEEVLPAIGLDRPVLVRGHGEERYWGEAVLVADLLQRGVELLAERAQGPGAISVDVAHAGEALRLRFEAIGEPTEGLDPATVRRFRHAVDALAGVVLPGELGVGANTCVVELPIPGGEPAAATAGSRLSS